VASLNRFEELWEGVERESRWGKRKARVNLALSEGPSQPSGFGLAAGWHFLGHFSVGWADHLFLRLLSVALAALAAPAAAAVEAVERSLNC